MVRGARGGKHRDGARQITPIICTRAERGNVAGTTCAETRYTNERRVGGWPGSFWTVRERESFVARVITVNFPPDAATRPY